MNIDTLVVKRGLSPVALVRSLLSDLGLLIFRNKAMVVFLIAVPCIFNPILLEWHSYRTLSDHALILQDPALKTIEGERISEANINHYWIEKNPQIFNGRALALNTDSLPEEGYISLKYHFSLKEDSVYKLFLAGRPPGPIEIKERFDTSPFDVIIDQELVIPVNQENKLKFLKKVFGNDFYQWYSYSAGMVMTKVGVLSFPAGDHEIEFRISKPAPYNNRYLFVLDAIFLVPDGWEPERRFSTLPDDFLSY